MVEEKLVSEGTLTPEMIEGHLLLQGDNHRTHKGLKSIVTTPSSFTVVFSTSLFILFFLLYCEHQSVPVYLFMYIQTCIRIT